MRVSVLSPEFATQSAPSPAAMSTGERPTGTFCTSAVGACGAGVDAVGSSADPPPPPLVASTAATAAIATTATMPSTTSGRRVRSGAAGGRVGGGAVAATGSATGATWWVTVRAPRPSLDGCSGTVWARAPSAGASAASDGSVSAAASCTAATSSPHDP